MLSIWTISLFALEVAFGLLMLGLLIRFIPRQENDTELQEDRFYNSERMT